MLDKKYIKELKRRRKLEKRIKCHGNKLHCLVAHPPKVPIFSPSISAPPLRVGANKESWWRRLLRFLKII